MKLNLIILLLLSPLACAISFIFKTGDFVSTILFLIPPAIWLSVQAPHCIRRSAIFSFCFGIPIAIVGGYLLVADQAWNIPHSIGKILGIIAIEDILFSVLTGYILVMFYQYFFKQPRLRSISTHFKGFVKITLFFVIVFFILFMFAPQVLHVPYSFFLVCLVMMGLPVVVLFTKNKKLAPRLFWMCLYWLSIALWYEPTALVLGQWEFAGPHYLKVFSFFGHALPLEEVIFFWLLYAPAMILWYEFLVDDMK